ncbi:hypothetical protein TRAPUB_9934 [Trametes pubescens]|uniref:Uncharacterized protein n=1 Tax=Trametes pubescens TaxID=154538 RepID=A0A1M2W166_TRAPU|nr:hypothetical protein TRAPUB_9934 [Trametes pubescens]
MADFSSPLIYFLGWPVTLEWLETFAQCARDTPALADAAIIDIATIRILKALVCTQDPERHVMDVTLELVVHAEAPFHPRSETLSLAEHEFTVASIRNTVSIGNFLRIKPTRAQYAWLRAVMPGEPQWYRGITTREEFVDVMERLDIPIY